MDATRASTLRLQLKITTPQGPLEFLLEPGRELTLGRSPDCDVRLESPSVSHEHLRVTFTGEGVKVQDLNSSNGTLRMPQQSPFLEAKFPNVYDQLILQIAKVEVVFSWQAREREAQATGVFEKTYVEPGTEAGTTLSGAVPPLVHENKDEFGQIMPDRRLRARGPESSAAQRTATPVVYEPHVLAARAFLELGFAGLLALGAALLANNRWGNVWSVKPALLMGGGAIDGLTLWWMDFFALVLPALLGAAAICVAWNAVARSLCAWSSTVGARLANALAAMPGHDDRRWLWGARLLSVVLVAGFLCGPLWKALSLGVGPAQFKQAVALSHLLKRPLARNSSVEQWNAEAASLRALLPSLQGSSLLYVAMMDNQRGRIVRTCGGAGDKPWLIKKICLQALVASSVETSEIVQPALLRDVAERAAVLLTLDSVAQVVGVEGHGEKPSAPFLNLLHLGGYEADAQSILEVLSDNSVSDTQRALRLREFRYAVETGFMGLQSSLRLPARLRLNLAGPLEIGI